MWNHKIITYSAPYLFMLALILCEASYNSLLYFKDATPYYELIVVFYWCLISPKSLPYVALFILGFIRDELLLGYPGISSFSFIAMKVLLDYQRDYCAEQKFIGIWMVFTANLTVILFSQLILLNIKLVYSQYWLVMFYLKKWLLTSALYLPTSALFFSVYRKLSLINKETDAVSK